MNVPELLAFVLSSLLAIGLALYCFKRRPATRRLFLLVLAALLIAIPLVVFVLDLRFSVGLVEVQPPAFASLSVELLVVLLLSGLVHLAFRMVGLLRARLRLNRLPLVQASALDAPLREFAGALGLNVLPVLREGPQACSTTLGASVIVLPRAWQRWSPTTIRAVLAHELVHIVRRDDVCLQFLRGVSQVLWWLPWLRLLPSLFESAMEESCDDLAAFIVRSDIAYLDGVYDAARAAAGPLAPTAALTGASLPERVRRFGSFRDQHIDSRGLYWACLTGALLLTALWSVNFRTVADPAAGELRLIGKVLRAGFGAEVGAEEGISVQLRTPPQAPVGADAVRRNPTPPAPAPGSTDPPAAP
ncbi:MAG: M56 family metallopeptidase [Pseudomonadota bacterium]